MVAKLDSTVCILHHNWSCVHNFVVDPGQPIIKTGDGVPDWCALDDPERSSIQDNRKVSILCIKINMKSSPKVFR